MKKSNAKPKVRANLLIVDEIKMNWTSTQGLVISSGEAISDVLRKYGQTIEDLELFWSQQNSNRTRGEGGSSNNQTSSM